MMCYPRDSFYRFKQLYETGGELWFCRSCSRDLERLRLRPSVIESMPRHIVGWRTSRTAHAGFVLDALKQGSMIGVLFAAAACPP
jgi:hypothetical protein